MNKKWHLKMEDEHYNKFDFDFATEEELVCFISSASANSSNSKIEFNITLNGQGEE